MLHESIEYDLIIYNEYNKKHKPYSDADLSLTKTTKLSIKPILQALWQSQVFFFNHISLFLHLWLSIHRPPQCPLHLSTFHKWPRRGVTMEKRERDQNFSSVLSHVDPYKGPEREQEYLPHSVLPKMKHITIFPRRYYSTSYVFSASRSNTVVDGA